MLSGYPLPVTNAAAVFTLSNLIVLPVAVTAGTPVTVSVGVLNTGTSGTSDVVLELEGIIAQRKSLTLDAGESTTVNFEVGTNTYDGNIDVKVGTLTSSFTVLLQLLPPSSLLIGNFTLSPKEIAPGSPVKVDLDIRNTGPISGLFDFRVSLDGVVKTEKTGDLLPNQKTRVSFNITSPDPGTHVVEAAGFSATFAVAKPFSISDYALPILLAGESIIIVAVVGILLRRRMRARTSGVSTQD